MVLAGEGIICSCSDFEERGGGGGLPLVFVGGGGTGLRVDEVYVGFDIGSFSVLLTLFELIGDSSYFIYLLSSKASIKLLLA